MRPATGMPGLPCQSFRGAALSEVQTVVSAQHTKCVYCRTPFTNELPETAFADEGPAIRRPR